MRARYILETGQWEKIPLESPASRRAPPAPAAAVAPARHAGMPGMPGMRPAYDANGTWTFIAGFSAAKLGDRPPRSRPPRSCMPWPSALLRREAYGAKPFAIMEKEVAPSRNSRVGNKDEAVRLAKEAADIELT